MFERVRRHVAPGGTIYLVGMQPLPDHPGELVVVVSVFRTNIMLECKLLLGTLEDDGELFVLVRICRSPVIQTEWRHERKSPAPRDRRGGIVPVYVQLFHFNLSRTNFRRSLG